MKIGMIIGEATPLSWDRWKHIVQLAESLGFNSLFRSDHFYNSTQKDAIDVFLSFVVAAEQTERIRFGTLVTPVTFREPVNVGRMAQQLDALSDGRFVMGLGVGWYAEEHQVYGLDFPATGERFDRLEEAIALMKELWYSEAGSFAGEYYRIEGTDSKPHPPPGRPNILLGGNGPKRTLKIAAEHAHEWNAMPTTIAGYAAASEALERHCATFDRDPADISRSQLLFAAIGPDKRSEDLALNRFLEMMSPARGPVMTLDKAKAAGRAPWQGSIEQLVDHVGQLGEMGVEEVILEHFCHEEDDIPQWIASEVMPAVASI